MEHTIFGKDTTIRLSCRTGDYLSWFGFKGIFSPEYDQYKINDTWQLTDGDFVTITNRQVDLPCWFELHPLEVSGSLVYWMQSKLDSGYQPGEIVKRPNIWRALTGDRLVWVGEQRQGVEFNNGVLSVITFSENAAIIGESYSDFDGFPRFDQEEQRQEDMKLCRNGMNAILELGTPRSVSPAF
ncbi:MAG: hypothetical protein D8M57_14525 [Candidatus Scalindua sp. AMX11]|nr:MAG: hypothetical protein DWQ00_17365 [Candidatus Scalindua sp.]NOG83902.1 hypothetical protein [Planctomycetota bacterium]RZV87974.1 MAG: hypothetical protein EX341_06600 [Candidatus Scalindua sp. SCAELEC01]TDE64123.1 MAG: hypothetical protein D8M57_14525 [Candidatus Scalindua sp. AMX11]GJQ58450.1 MAG: hypothetical protein SCALA701_12510 [Candidatus Scalindua sp.]